MSTKERQILRLDSQMLTAYQNCERSYEYSFVENLEPIIISKSLNVGTVFHALFEYVNRGLLEKRKRSELVLEALQVIPKDIPLQEQLSISKRFMEYYDHYDIEDSAYKIISAERGFSKVIYEDENVIFVYEGRIDAIFYHNRERAFIWRDYKTRSGNYQIYQHTNQFYGYSWALQDEGDFRGEIDYIGKAEKKTDKTFERQIVSFHKDQIARWKEETIGTFWDILKEKEIPVSPVDRRYKRRLTSCETKYGLCPFHKICERDPIVYDQIKKINYKQKEKEWSAW